VADTIGDSTVMYVSPNDADGVLLQHIFNGFGWKPAYTLIARSTLDSAVSVLQEMPIAIVICEVDLMPGTWQEMLECISRLPDPPLLIVTSRLADERLWAEALNLGAYDLLARPFDPTEVRRIVDLAWSHWQDRNVLHYVRTEERKMATGA